MTKRTVFTTISPLPAGISREVVLDFLHNHTELIDLNPLVIERHPIDVPSNASPEERRCVWYSLTDKIDYLPGGKVSGDISYTCAFHDLPNGIQTHCRAPLGVDIREKWFLCGSLPGEPHDPLELGLVELGAPASGLYIREDVDLRCNLLMTNFVKKNLKRSHATLVERLVEKAKFASGLDAVGGSPLASISSHSYASSSTSTWTPSSPYASSMPPTATPYYAGRQDEIHQMNSPSPKHFSSLPVRTRSTVYQNPGVASYRTHTRTISTPAQMQFHAQCPPILRAPIRPPHHRTPSLPQAPSLAPLGQQSTPTPTPPAEAFYPAPLRIRNPSIRSGSSASSQQMVLLVETVPQSSPTATASRTSSEYDSHPDYPHLSPYSPAADSNDDADEPRTPEEEETIAIGLGKREEKKEEVVMGTIEHPESLRPGSWANLSGRLSGPFVAELM